MNPSQSIEPAVREASALAARQLAGRLSAAALVRADEPLAKRTTLRVGGPAEVYVEPASEADLAAVLGWCRQQGRNFFVLGRGSNLLVRDGGVRGVVICLVQEAFSGLESEGRRLRCGAGVRLKALAQEAKRQELTGLEFLEGIPGSLGGALRMNAGAMGSAIFEVVESVRLMDYEGRVSQQPSRELAVGYRRCATLESQIALGAVLVGQEGQRQAIEGRMSEWSRKRWASQPAAPSAGCMFKNPPAIGAGKLLDELGLKGSRVGGASVSQEHGNFIVNDGSASARDVLELVEQLRQRVRAQRGIELEMEVQIVGEEHV